MIGLTIAVAFKAADAAERLRLAEQKKSTQNCGSDSKTSYFPVILSFMKIVSLFFIVMILVGACAPPKKTVKKDSPTVTRADELKGGTSFSNAIVIMVQKERAGLDEEYRWLSNSYPGYSLIRKNHVTRSSKHYDIVRIKTKEGHVKDIYFDCTRFWGKN